MAVTVNSKIAQDTRRTRGVFVFSPSPTASGTTGVSPVGNSLPKPFNGMSRETQTHRSVRVFHTPPFDTRKEEVHDDRKSTQ